MITTSSYKKVASLVITLLVLIGATALVLFGIWFASSVFKGQPPPVAVQLYGDGYGDGEGGTGPRDDGPEWRPSRPVHNGTWSAPPTSESTPKAKPKRTSMSFSS